jgi:hypothetical protein
MNAVWEYSIQHRNQPSGCHELHPERPFTIYHLPFTFYHSPWLQDRHAARRKSLIPAPLPYSTRQSLIRLPERSSRNRVDCEPSAIHHRPNPPLFGMEWNGMVSARPRPAKFGSEEGQHVTPASEPRNSGAHSDGSTTQHPARTPLIPLTPLTPTRCP